MLNPTSQSPTVSSDEIQNVAKLARLALNASKIERLTKQLPSILEYVAQIGEVDVSAVEPMTRVGTGGNVMREDIVEPGLTVEQVLQNAPATDGPYFKVPKIIGGTTSEEDSAG